MSYVFTHRTSIPVRDTLLTGSFGDRLLKSLEYLGFKARSHNAATACESIHRVVSEQQKYALFRDLFPDEWSRSSASLYRAGRFTKYSERTNQLFELIDEKCFPLLGYWHDDPEIDFEQFTIQPLNFDLCCEEFDFEDLRISYVAGLLFYFSDSEIWDFFSEKFGVSSSDFPEINRQAHPRVWKDEHKPITAQYSKLIRLVDHSTGNPWLDSSHCQYPILFDWNKKSIEEVTEAYSAAKRTFDTLQELDALIEADPKKALLDLINFWNTGRLREK